MHAEDSFYGWKAVIYKQLFCRQPTHSDHSELGAENSAVVVSISPVYQELYGFQAVCVRICIHIEIHLYLCAHMYLHMSICLHIQYFMSVYMYIYICADI